MSLLDAVHTTLAAAEDVTNIVADRLYRNVMPQGTALPAIVLHRISTTHEHDLSGLSGSAESRVQVDCWAADPLSADSLNDAVRLALDGQTGEVGGVTIDHVLIEDTSDDYDPPADASDQGAHRASSDFLIRYQETIPS